MSREEPASVVEVPERFMGPMSTVAMFDPVALTDGHVYERAMVNSLVAFAKSRHEVVIHSPMTRQPISIASLEGLKTSVYVRNDINAWLEASPEHRRAYLLQAFVPETPAEIAALASERDQRLCLAAWACRLQAGMVEWPSSEHELLQWLDLVWRLNHEVALTVCLAKCEVSTLKLLASGTTPATHRALRAGKQGLLFAMLKHSPDLLEQVDAKGYCLIQLAAKLGISESVERLAKYGTKQIEVTRPSGDNLAHIAARFGRGRVLTVLQTICPHLLERSNKRGDYPAHIAVKHGRVKTTRRLVGLAPEVFTLPGKSGCSALKLAKKKGDKKLVSVLRARPGWESFFRSQSSGKKKAIVEQAPAAVGSRVP